MNWDAIGAVGEVVGAIAVIASIVYLATQIRSNSEIARSQSQRELLEIGSWFSGSATNPELRNVIRSGFDDFSSLSKDTFVFVALRICLFKFSMEFVVYIIRLTAGG